VIQCFDFPISYLLLSIRVGIFILAIIIALTIIPKWYLKLITVIAIILFSLMQGELKLWKIPAKRYVIEFEKEYDKTMSQINENDSLRSCIMRPEGLLFIKVDHNRDTVLLSDPNLHYLVSVIKDSDVIQIEKTEHVTLFIMSRFIDNGYGICIITEENMKKIENEDRFRINGYDVTGFTHLKGNWYYLSFT